MCLSVENIFRKDYLKNLPRWTKNLLDYDSKNFQKDDLVSFLDSHGHRHVGRLKWMGSIPWSESEGRLFGIECVSFVAAAILKFCLKFASLFSAEEVTNQLGQSLREFRSSDGC